MQFVWATRFGKFRVLVISGLTLEWNALPGDRVLIIDRLPATVLVCVAILVCVTGCAGFGGRVELPTEKQFDREQLKVYSDIKLPNNHRLLQDLSARRRDIANILLLPMSDEPINVFLFKDEKRYQRYLKQNHPQFPERRAFFVKNDTELKVFAHWGEFVAEDLRHEVTHGYLHATVPNISLWLDEGLAEYFEVPRGDRGFHRQHIYFLTQHARANEWNPSLRRLESLEDPTRMTQLDYAESWLWVHYLLETKPEYRKLLQDQLARDRMTGKPQPLSHYLHELVGDEQDEVIGHLVELSHTMKKEQ